ncbi:hypothetical protein [Pelagicoccus sp. SDUM812003]|uniref:hypothetical protein n=1 Tax=Pelagicoccus sp. SDUM812003 TaxID=3041267 RepID=UPI0028103E2D|nr:hypothetical protein [Pelagicoccus sp. SDUM812003]MDQ8204784.1 hypothetical protein [Pelagicoccus sp. SDUM812003]
MIESAKEVFTQLSPLQIGVGAIALLFLAIGLRLVLKKPPAHLTAFSGNAGNVLVSRKALQELVKQACLLDDWVEAARPIIRVKSDKVEARVELRLSRPDNLKDVCERVQGHITALLQKSLSFDQIGSIQIVVKSFGSESRETNVLIEERPAQSELGSASPAAVQTPTEPQADQTPTGSSTAKGDENDQKDRGV